MEESPTGLFQALDGCTACQLHGRYTTLPATQCEEKHSVALILAQKALLKYFQSKKGRTILRCQIFSYAKQVSQE